VTITDHTSHPAGRRPAPRRGDRPAPRVRAATPQRAYGSPFRDHTRTCRHDIPNWLATVAAEVSETDQGEILPPAVDVNNCDIQVFSVAQVEEVTGAIRLRTAQAAVDALRNPHAPKNVSQP